MVSQSSFLRSTELVTELGIMLELHFLIYITVDQQN